MALPFPSLCWLLAALGTLASSVCVSSLLTRIQITGLGPTLTQRDLILIISAKDPISNVMGGHELVEDTDPLHSWWILLLLKTHHKRWRSCGARGQNLGDDGQTLLLMGVALGKLLNCSLL